MFIEMESREISMVTFFPLDIAMMYDDDDQIDKQLCIVQLMGGGIINVSLLHLSSFNLKQNKLAHDFRVTVEVP